MFYQSAADSELPRVAEPGDVALSKDKQADKKSRRHSLSASEAPWRRAKEERMINRSSCRAPPHLLRSCSKVTICPMLEWDIDSCPIRSSWQQTHQLRPLLLYPSISTKDCTLGAPKEVFPLSWKPQKIKPEIFIQIYSFCPLESMRSQLQAAVLGFNFTLSTANMWFSPLDKVKVSQWHFHRKL